MNKSKTMQKIFIVEDDDGIASSIKAYAEGWGYEVKTVCDFRNVLQEFEQYSPHIVLMDIIAVLQRVLLVSGNQKKL